VGLPAAAPSLLLSAAPVPEEVALGLYLRGAPQMADRAPILPGVSVGSFHLAAFAMSNLWDLRPGRFCWSWCGASSLSRSADHLPSKATKPLGLGQQVCHGG